MLVDRYLLREVSLPFIGVSSALLVVFLTYSITAFLAKASGELLNIGEIAHLTFLKSLIALEVLLPMGLYLGVIIGLGRLYSDSEIYALQGTGIGEGRLLRPILLFGISMAVLISLLSTVVRPWAYGEAYDLRAAAAAASDLERLKPGQFFVDEEGGQTIFVQSMSDDHRELQGIFVRSHDDRGLQVVSSATGHLEPSASIDRQKLVLHDASVYKQADDGPNLLGHFRSLSIFLQSGDPEIVGYKVKSQSTVSLQNYRDSTEKAEYQWRLSTSLSTLLLVLVAVPLSRSLPRRGRYGKIMIALLVYALYLNVITVAKTWVEQDRASTIWWVPGLLAIAAVVLYFPWRNLARHRSAKGSRAHH